MEEKIDQMRIGSFAKVWEEDTETWAVGTIATRNRKKKLVTLLIPRGDRVIVANKSDTYKSDVEEWIATNSRY